MRRLDIDFLESYDDESLLEELRRIAFAGGRDTVTKAEIESIGRASYELFWKRFGSLRRALQLAGLSPGPFTKATEEELLSLLVDLWERVLEEEGRTPQRRDLKTYNCAVSGDTYTRRFGSWTKALTRAARSVTAASPADDDSPVPGRTEPRTREAISIRKRFFVMKRDSFACVLCGASGHGVRLEVDHKVPFAVGGGDDLRNLQTLCFGCNRGKRDSLESRR